MMGSCFGIVQTLAGTAAVLFMFYKVSDLVKFFEMDLRIKPLVSISLFMLCGLIVVLLTGQQDIIVSLSTESVLHFFHHPFDFLLVFGISFALFSLFATVPLMFIGFLYLYLFGIQEDD